MDELNNQIPEGKPGKKTKAPKEPKVHKKGKLKVIICVVVIVVAAIIAGVVYAVLSGKVNFTKSQKFFNGISKAKEVLTAPIDALTEGEELKISDSLSDSDIEYTADVTASIDTLEISDSSLDSTTLDTFKTLVNNAKISIDAKYDHDGGGIEGKATISVTDLLDEISADIVYNNDTLGIAFPELSETYLSVTKESLEEYLNSLSSSSSSYYSSSSTDTLQESLDAVLSMVESISDSSGSIANELSFTDEESEHFTKTYKDIFKKQIDSGDIKTSSDTIEVDGKDKKVTKAVVKLSDSDVQDIIKAYVEAFDDDDEGKEILTEKILAIVSLLGDDFQEELGVSITESSINDLYDEGVDEIISSLESITFDGDIVITSYATMFNVYGLDIEYVEDDNSAGISLTFGKDETTFDIEIDATGISATIASGTITSTDEKQALYVEVSDEVLELAGVDVSDVNFEIGVETESDTDSKFYIKGQAGSYGSAEISVNTSISENSENKYSDTSTVSINIDVPSYITFVGSLKINETLSTSDVSIPTLTSANSIDVLGDTATTDLQNYYTEIESKLNTYLTSMQSSSLYTQIESIMSSNSSSSYNTYDYNTYDYNTYDYNTYDYNTYDYNTYDYNTYDYNTYDYNTTTNSLYDYNSTTDANSVIGY